jgi:hypothetical protein
LAPLEPTVVPPREPVFAVAPERFAVLLFAELLAAVLVFVREAVFVAPVRLERFAAPVFAEPLALFVEALRADVFLAAVFLAAVFLVDALWADARLAGAFFEEAFRDALVARPPAARRVAADVREPRPPAPLDAVRCDRNLKKRLVPPEPTSSWCRKASLLSSKIWKNSSHEVSSSFSSSSPKSKRRMPPRPRPVRTTEGRPPRSSAQRRISS